jgi:hypothetical protein
MKLNNHYRILFKSCRISFVCIIGFIIYEILLKLEKKWNVMNPRDKKYNVYKRYIIKFIIMFLVSIIILYIMYFFTNIVF